MTDSTTPTTNQTSDKGPLEDNPLEKVNPKSLDELFDMDPELLTQEDLGRMVERMRQARATFAQSEQAGKGKGKQIGEKGLPVDLAQLGFTDF